MELLETFNIKNGQVLHLDFHQQRVDRSLFDLYQIDKGFSLINFFENQQLPSQGMFRGRLVYEEQIKSFEIIPYQEQFIKTFKLVDCGSYDYSYKWADRSFFADQKSKFPEVDEIIFYSNHTIQDCTIANLAFLKNGVWYTPKSPLLKGTTRERLLSTNQIQELDIFVHEIDQFDRICLINVFRELSLENSLSLAACIL